jgi:hypothetical protein
MLSKLLLDSQVQAYFKCPSPEIIAHMVVQGIMNKLSRVHTGPDVFEKPWVV